MKRDELLHGFARTLLQGWRFEQVVDALRAELEAKKGEIAEAPQDKSALSEVKKSAKKRIKSAEEYTLMLAARDKNLQSIKEVAERFDRKEFLPTIGDVRHFLSMSGRDAGGFKNRQQATRRVVEALLDVSEKTLVEIKERRLYAGPSDLEPLSEAIRHFAQQQRSS